MAEFTWEREGGREENRMRLPSTMIVGVEVSLHLYFY